MLYILFYCKSIKTEENPYSQVACQHTYIQIWKLQNWLLIKRTTFFLRVVLKIQSQIVNTLNNSLLFAKLQYVELPKTE